MQKVWNRRALLLMLLALLVAVGFANVGQPQLALAQTAILFEDFEDPSVTYTTSVPEFSDGSGDFFTRTDGSNIGSFVQYSNVKGTSFFAGMDLDGEGATLPLEMTFANVDISNMNDLQFSILLAEDDDGSNQDWDEPDSVKIAYRIDGGGFQNLLAIENDGTTFNTAPLLDTNFDGTGDGTEITATFTEFNAAIAGSGSTLDLKITFQLDSGDEDIALDNVQISGTASGPTPVLINEMQVSTTGTDWEFFELQGTPGTDLTGLTLIGIESDAGTAAGRIDRVIDLSGQTIPADGFFLGISPAGTAQYGVTGEMAIADNSFENSTATYLLVTGFTGSVGDDLDADDTAPLDSTPWTAIVDEVTIRDADANDLLYSSVVAGPDGTNLPAGIYRCPDAPTGTFANGGFHDFNNADGTPGVSNAAQCTTTDTPPTLTGTTPADGATGVATATNVTVNFSEAVDLTAAAATIECPTGTAVSFSGLPASAVTSVTLDPASDLPASSTCTVTLDPTQITDTDGDADQLSGTSSFTFTTADPAVACAGGTITPISAIQGNGAASPLANTVVTVEAIVVGDFQDGTGSNGDLNGFYLQEETGDEDGDEATSEGIFVFDGNNPAVDVTNGATVRVTGKVEEFNDLTELTNVSAVEVCPIASSLAAVNQRQIALPHADESELERYENMYVTFPQALVIAEYFNYDRFGEMVLALPLNGEDRPYTPTAVEEPGSAAAAARAAENLRSRITLDDGRTVQNPIPVRHPNGGDFSLSNRFRGGDTVQNATGILSYSFSRYRLQPTAPALYTALNPRPAQPEAVGGTLKVASFNVLNYFNGDGQGGGFPTARGAESEQEFQQQEAKIVAAIIGTGADIVGLIEIENDPTGANSALDDLVDAINAVAGAGTFAYIATGTDGTDAIKVALIYKPATVAPTGVAAVLEAPSFVDPANSGTGKNRPALAQTFVENSSGEAVTVVVNHLKSKGSGCGAGDDDPEQGNCNRTRALAAQALADWLATDPTGSGDPDYLIIGDLNAYDKEDPIDALKLGADETAGTADDYVDLLLRDVGEFAYSYLFNGQFGYLDYALANATLAPQVAGTTVWQINADEPDILDYNINLDNDPAPERDPSWYAPDAYRASDHDPVIVGLNLASGAAPANIIYLSTWFGGRAGDLHFRAEDIVYYDPEAAAWGILFDGSNVGVRRANLDAFTFVNDEAGLSILMSFNRALLMRIDGRITAIDDSDIVRFVPTQLGHNSTAGSFEQYFMGVDVGLERSSEDIDALALDAQGNLVLSTMGTLSTPDLQAADEDLVVATGLQAPLSILFDGSDVGLTAGSEDIGALWIDGNKLYLTTKLWFRAEGNNGPLEGDATDIFVCELLNTGSNTACNLSPFFSAWDHGLLGLIDAIALGDAMPLAAIVAGQGMTATDTIDQFESIADEIKGQESDAEVDKFDLLLEESEASVHQLYLPLLSK